MKINIEGLDLENVQIEKIECSISAVLSTIIKTSDGKVYGAGANTNGNFGIGNYTAQTKFIELSSIDENWKEAKDIINIGQSTYVLQQDGKLYACGLTVTSQTKNPNLVLLAENVVEIEANSDSTLRYIDSEGKLWKSAKGVNTQITNIQNTDMKFISKEIVVSNSKMYKVGTSTVSNYYHTYTVDTEKILKSKNMNCFISNNKLYIVGMPDVTLPKYKAIYELKDVMKDVTFAQGNGAYFNIVKYNGSVYTEMAENTELTNIRKLISSVSNKYAIDNTGQLYARGNGYTGMWGDTTSKSSFQKITRDGTEYFNNVKDIYTSKRGSSAIIITNDNKMYWAGSTGYISLPNIAGDIQTSTAGTVTKYPKEVNIDIIDAILPTIVDIKYSSINSGGITAANTLILTEDGKLYTHSSNNKNVTGLNKKVSTDFEELSILPNATIKQVETMDGLSLVILSNGDVYGWGYNTYGILGNGYEVGEIYPTPVKLAISNIDYISLGEGFAIFASNTGEIYGIGANDYGQLGTGNNIGAPEFVRCPELEK